MIIIAGRFRDVRYSNSSIIIQMQFLEESTSEYTSKHVGIYGNTYGNNVPELSEGGNHSNWACSNMRFVICIF